MSLGLSTYLAGKILDWLDGTNMPSAPSDVYVAVHDGSPTDAGTGGTEVTTTIRVAGRVAVTWDSIVSKTRANSADVDFGNAAGGCNATHISIWDAASAGNMLCSAALPTPRTIATSDPVKVAVGDLIVDLTTP